jgi:hypothetical protein
MTGTFAVGKKAHAFCDVCGFRCFLAEMRTKVVGGRTTGIKTCPSCYDPDHPQNWQGRFPVADPQALRDPRPDTAMDASRELPGGTP